MEYNGSFIRARRKHSSVDGRIINSISTCNISCKKCKRMSLNSIDKIAKPQIQQRTTTPGISVMTSTNEDIITNNYKRPNLYSLIKISQFGGKRASREECRFSKGKAVVEKKSICREVIKVPSIKLLNNIA